jgi:gluconolactonase
MADADVIVRGLKAPYGLAFDADDVLFVSEMGASRVSRVEQGRVGPFATTGARPRGIAFDDSGDLFVAEGGRHHLILISPDEAVEVYASTCSGKRFASPQELCFAPTGDVIFSDAGHGEAEDDGSVYQADLDGEVTEIVTGLSSPSGMTLSEDASALYVSERGRHRIITLEIDDEGTLVNQQVVADLPDDGAAECLLFDSQGQLYASVPGQGVLQFDPEGTLVRTLDLPGTNLAGMTFGGLEFDELYVCESDSIVRLQLEAPGQRPFAGPRAV